MKILNKIIGIILISVPIIFIIVGFVVLAVEEKQVPEMLTAVGIVTCIPLGAWLLFKD